MKVWLLLAVAVATWTSLGTQSLNPSKDIPALEATVARDSNDAQLHYQLAIAYWSRKRFDDAGRSLQTAVTIERRFAAAYLALGYLPHGRRRKLMEEEAKGDVPIEWRDSVIEAARLRRRAFLINPLVDLQIVGAVVPINVSVLAKISFGGVTFDPFSALIRQDYQLAFATFNRWVAEAAKQSPKDAVPSGLLWLRGLSAAQAAAYDTAISDFRRLLERSETVERDSLTTIPLMTNDFRYMLATLKYRSRRLDEAIDLYKEALANDAGLFMAHIQLGRIFEERHMLPQAVEHYRAAVATSPDDPSLLLDLGIALRQAGHLAESEATLTDAMTANPRDSRVPYHLGLTLQQQGKGPEARVAFNRFLVLAPSRYERQIRDAKRRSDSFP